MDVSKLKNISREDKLKLYDYIQEKKRRKKERKDIFQPNSGQEPILKSEAKERWVTAANGGGKTALAVHDAIWTAKGYNPVANRYNKVPLRIIVLLDSPNKVTDLWLPEIAKWFNTDDWTFNKKGKYFVSEIVLPNGSQIMFMFHEQSPMAFESIEWGHLVCDEPPPRNVYVALKRGGRTKGTEGRVLVIGTPVSQAWIRKEVIEPWSKGERPNTECFKFSTYVNKENLAEGYIDHFERILSEKERRIRLYGEFYDLSGLALAHLFDRDVHIIEPFEWPRNWPCIVAIDPAQAKPNVAILLGITPKNELIYIDELSEKTSPREFARSLRNFYRGYPLLEIVCDSLGSADTTGGEGLKSFIDVLNDEGVRARATTHKDKDDERWIANIKDALLVTENEDGSRSGPRLKIFRGNDMIIHDIENVSWQKYKNDDMHKPKLDISQKDALACLKYALAANPDYRSRKGSKGIYSPSIVSWRDRYII